MRSVLVALRLPVFAVLAAAVLPAFHAAVVAVTVLLLAVGFGALAALALPHPLAAHLLAKGGQSLGVHLYVGAVGALALLAAEERVAEAVAVKLEALGLLAVALEFALVLGRPGLGRLYGDEGVVLEDVLEAIVLGELYGVELSELYLAPLPFAHQIGEQVLPLFGLIAQEDQLALLADLVGHPFGVRRNTQLTYIHSLYKSSSSPCYMARKIIHNQHRETRNLRQGKNGLEAGNGKLWLNGGEC